MSMNVKIALNQILLFAGVPVLLAMDEPGSSIRMVLLVACIVVYGLLGWFLQPFIGLGGFRPMLWLLPPFLLAAYALVTVNYLGFGPVMVFFSVSQLRSNCTETQDLPAVNWRGWSRLFLALLPSGVVLACLALFSTHFDVIVGRVILWLISRA